MNLRVIRFCIILLLCVVLSTSYYLYRDSIALWVNRYMTDAGLVLEEIMINAEGKGGFSAPSMEMKLLQLKGKPIYSIELDSVLQQVMSANWVKGCSVGRALPNRIVVNVTEYMPFMVWQNGIKKVICNDLGMVVEDWVDRRHSHSLSYLPLVVTSDSPLKALEVIKFIAKDKRLAAKFAKLESVHNRRWDMHLKTGTIIKLPEKSWEQALKFVSLNQEKIFISGSDVVDMRVPDKIFLSKNTRTKKSS